MGKVTKHIEAKLIKAGWMKATPIRWEHPTRGTLYRDSNAGGWLLFPKRGVNNSTRMGDNLTQVCKKLGL